MEEINNFYVYVYLDTRKKGIYIFGGESFDFVPIYIGKGRNGRGFSHIKLCDNMKNKTYNTFFYRKIRKIKHATGKNPVVIILSKDMSEKGALALEKKLIKTIGRLDLGTGPLCNFTDGGEGTSNPPKWVIEKRRDYFKNLWKDPIYRTKIINMLKDRKLTASQKSKLLEGRRKVGWHCSESTKVKIGKANKGHLVSDSCKEKLSSIFKGRLVLKETKEKISAALKGKKLLESTKKKISAKLKGREVSKETRKRMSIASTGRLHTAKAKEKMSAAKKGRTLSEAQKIMIGNRHRGEKKTEKTRANMSAGAKKRWEKYRNQKILKGLYTETLEGMLEGIPIG